MSEPTDPLNPSAALLSKLGSLIVHYEEAAGPRPHPFDWQAIKQLNADPDVVAWRLAMGRLALLPAKRQEADHV